MLPSPWLHWAMHWTLNLCWHTLADRRPLGGVMHEGRVVRFRGVPISIQVLHAGAALASIVEHSQDK